MTIPPTGTQWRSVLPERGAALGTDDRPPPGETRAKSKTARDTKIAMRPILPNVMGTSSSFLCAENLPATLRPRVEEFYLSHWMRTLAQPRTKIKNLAGGLLVPWQVVDFRQLIPQGYRLPVPFVQIPSMINCISFGSESANGSHPHPTSGGKVWGLRSGSAGRGGSQGRHEAEARGPALPGIASTVGASTGNRHAGGSPRAHLAGKCLH